MSTVSCKERNKGSFALYNIWLFFWRSLFETAWFGMRKWKLWSKMGERESLSSMAPPSCYASISKTNVKYTHNSQ